MIVTIDWLEKESKNQVEERIEKRLKEFEEKGLELGDFSIDKILRLKNATLECWPSKHVNPIVATYYSLATKYHFDILIFEDCIFSGLIATSIPEITVKFICTEFRSVQFQELCNTTFLNCRFNYGARFYGSLQNVKFLDCIGEPYIAPIYFGWQNIHLGEKITLNEVKIMGDFISVEFNGCDFGDDVYFEGSIQELTIRECSRCENIERAPHFTVGKTVCDLKTFYRRAIDEIEAFETTSEGIIAYKIFNLCYQAPWYWDLKPGSILEEFCDPSVFTRCSSGINVSTFEYLIAHCGLNIFKNNTVWRVLIPWKDLVGVTMPNDNPGMMRCERVKLLEPLEWEEVEAKIKEVEESERWTNNT